MQYQNLAQEVCDNIVALMDPPTLKNARLVSRSLSIPATQSLFHTITLAPELWYREQWNEFIQNETLRHVPRRLIIKTSPDGFDPNEEWDPDEEGNYFAEFDRITSFPSLQAVQIVFSTECSDGGDMYVDVVEDHRLRERALTEIFKAVEKHRGMLASSSFPENEQGADRRGKAGGRGITSLAIQNLQNTPLPTFTSSPLFLSVMSHIKELELCMVVEVNEHGPDHDEFKPDVRLFPPHLRKKWLEPFSDKLEKLTLYYRDIWGGVPGYFDGKGLRFPRMKSLLIGNMAICYADQLDWVYEQKSLEKLGFFHCGIAARLSIDGWSMGRWGNQVSTRDWRNPTARQKAEEAARYLRLHQGGTVGETASAGEMGEAERMTPTEANAVVEGEYIYDGTWEEIFNRVAKELPNLRDFKLDWNKRTDWEEEFDSRHKIGTRLACQRYFAYNSGILPSRWSEPDSMEKDAYRSPSINWEGGMQAGDDLINRHVDTIDGDRKAFEELVGLVRKRAAGKEL